MEQNKQHQPSPMRLFIYEIYPLVIVLIMVAVLFIGYMQIIDVQLQNYRLSKYQLLASAKVQNQLLASVLDGYRSAAPEEIAPAERALADLALPEEFDFSNLAVQLNAMAENNGFKISSLENRAAEADNFTAADANLKGVDVTVRLKGGDYGSLKKLLNDLKTSILYLNVNGLSYQESGYELQLRTYYYQAL